MSGGGKVGDTHNQPESLRLIKGKNTFGVAVVQRCVSLGRLVIVHSVHVIIGSIFVDLSERVLHRMSGVVEPDLRELP